MRKILKYFSTAAMLFCFGMVCHGEDGIYTKSREVAIRSEADRALEADWRSKDLLPVKEASDYVLVRRVTLDLAGRLPTVAEAKSYVYSRDPQKYEALVDKLLSGPDFVNYWSMHFADMLRIKSEFPINLWPNAVYVYMRRVNSFIEKNEPYDRFVRSLLLSQGSNFRVAEANFYRAHADRSPLGIAKGAALSFCGIRLEKRSPEEQQLWANIFSEIGFKSTREWKEEIVFVKAMPEREIILPDGKKVKVPAGKEARKVFADALTRSGSGRKLLAQALVNRTWYRFFGAGLVPGGDDVDGGKAVNEKLYDVLTAAVLKDNFNFKKLCRMIVTSAAYKSASFHEGESRKRCAAFAAYPVRRLEAEVLDDVIRDITGARGDYASVIPEPFTFLPGEMRTVQIADGSISSSFLILFGRPSRDAGTLAERNDTVNAKQRLFLYNSGQLYRQVSRISRKRELASLPIGSRIEQFYWLFYSRPPMPREIEVIMKRYNSMPPKKRWSIINDLAWIMVNSSEFLHRH